jgi:hypothetical protein
MISQMIQQQQVFGDELNRKSYFEPNTRYDIVEWGTGTAADGWIPDAGDPWPGRPHLPGEETHPENNRQRSRGMIFLFYLVFTLAIELPLIVWLFKGPAAEKLRIGFALHLFTWSLMQILWAKAGVQLYFLEAGVVIIEAACYHIFFGSSWKRSFLVSLLANALSYGGAILLNPYL